MVATLARSFLSGITSAFNLKRKKALAVTSNFQSKTANEGADDAQITLLQVTGFGTANTAICRFGASSLTPPSDTSGLAPQYFNYIDDDGGSRIQILRPGIYDIEYAIGTDGLNEIEFAAYFGSFPPGPGQLPQTDTFIPNESLAVSTTFSQKNLLASQQATTFDRTWRYFLGGVGFTSNPNTATSNRISLTVYSTRFRPPAPPPNSFVLPEQNQNFLYFAGTPNLALGIATAVTVRVLNFLDN